MSEPQFKPFRLGFRVNPDIIADLRNPGPASRPTRSERMAWLWRDMKWRVRHAWAALVHGDCE